MHKCILLLVLVYKAAHNELISVNANLIAVYSKIKFFEPHIDFS